MSGWLGWLGVWCLTAAWLWLLPYYTAPDERGWVLAAAGTLLLVLAARTGAAEADPDKSGSPGGRGSGVLNLMRGGRTGAAEADPDKSGSPKRGGAGIRGGWWLWLAAGLGAAAVVWPWPYRAGPLLALIAVAIGGLRVASGRRGNLALAAGCLLLPAAVWIAQSAAAVAAWWLGARLHEAGWLTPAVVGLARLLGWRVGSSGGSLFLPTIDGPLQATTTWERLGLLPLLLLLAGGLVLWLVERHRTGAGRPLLGMAAVVGAYAGLRYLLLTAVLAAGGDGPDPALFWQPLPLALSFLPLALLLAAGAVRPGAGPRSAWQPRLGGWPRRGGPALVAACVLMAAAALLALLFAPRPGRPKGGRVLLDEYNSNWEWSTQALDTEWYGQKSGYNYYSLGQWLGHYYQVDTNLAPRTAGGLAGYDVLIVKTPTAAFAPAEVEAIDAWVAAGGGLLLIGDHTNVFGTSSYLNPLARRFGLRFRYDSTYDLATLRLSEYRRPALLAHPALVEMPPFLFATSCTLEVPLLAQNVMIGTGLRALPVDYSQRVFFPDKEKEQDYPFGLFFQSAAVRHGRGRVVAFSDSTVFSNFSMFLAGKPEYFLGVMGWLNQAEAWPWLDAALASVALVAGSGAAWLALGAPRAEGRAAAAAGLGALLLAAALVPWAGRQLSLAWYPRPVPHTEYVRVAFEDQHSRLALPTSPEAVPPQASFQTFYVWTQRLGYVPTLAPSLAEALTRGQVLVLIDLAAPLTPAELDALVAWVQAGGGLLVLAEGQSLAPATNQVLAPFGLAVEARATARAPVTNSLGEVLGTLAVSGQVRGGRPLLYLDGRAPILSLARHGEGLVAAAAFARPLTDAEMGSTSALPDEHRHFLYETEFWLLRGLVAGDLEPPRLAGQP